MNANKLKIIQVIHNTYKDKVFDFFKQKKKLNLSEEGKWKEMIYCILAGTQVPVEIAKKAQLSVIEHKDENGVIWNMKRLARKSEMNFEKLEYILRSSGYRHSKTKAKCIMNAAEFFVEQYKSGPHLLKLKNGLKL